jgi:hypothetical protein
MPADQRNFGYSDYLSDDGSHYCVKADAAWIADSQSGGATCTTARAYGRDTSRRHKRAAIFRDVTTFRTVKGPVFTPTAYAALVATPGTRAIHVPGETATVSYTQDSLIAEKLGRTAITRTDPDHA